MICVVDSCPESRRRLVEQFARLSPDGPAKAFSSIDEAISAGDKSRPRTVFVEPLLPDGKTFDATTIRQAASLGVAVIVVSESSSLQHVVTSIVAGARGYLFKPTCTPQQLLFAANGTHQGLLVLAHEHADLFDLLSVLPGPQVKLNRREAELITLLGRGWTDKEIARRFSIGEDTVGHYLTALYRKFSVRNRAELVALAGQSASQTLLLDECRQVT